MTSRRANKSRKVQYITQKLRSAYKDGKLTEGQIARLEAIGFEWVPRSSIPLSEADPELAKQWHPTKNGDLTPADVAVGSGRRVWWKCPDCGGEWAATVADRASGRGCPYCAGKKVLAGFNDLATKRPDLADEWHPTKNGDLTPRDVADGSEKKVWWKCNRCGHEWKAAIASRARSRRGCPKCAKAAIGMRNAKAVVRIEDGMYFPSLKNARLDGGDASNVTRACKTGRTAYGYHWRYTTEEEIAAHKAGEDSDGQGKE